MTTSALDRSITEQLLLGALREQDASLAAQAESQRAGYLAAASRRLSATLDEGETRDVIRRLTLPGRKAWCMLEVVEVDGALHRLGGFHPDPSRRTLAASLDHVWQPAEVPLRATARLGEYSVVTHSSGPALEQTVRDAESLRILDAIGFGWLLAIPLPTRARPQGTLIFVSAEREAPFSVREIVLAGEIGAICAMALDNARLYAEANMLRTAADVANRAKSAFLATMSHELRTPLNAIGGFVDLIDLGLYGPVTEPQRASLARVKKNQHHLLSVINEILDFARIEGGHMDCRREEVPLAPVVADVIAMLTAVAVERNLALVSVDETNGASAWGDPDRIRQILVNLVNNAVKYSAAGSGPITIATSTGPDGLLVRVSDHGPGIPLLMLRAIFQPFVQLNDGLVDRRGGVGLGLAISRELALAMDGTLTVESEVGAGSTFTLSLPAAPAGARPD